MDTGQDIRKTGWIQDKIYVRKTAWIQVSTIYTCTNTDTIMN